VFKQLELSYSQKMQGFAAPFSSLRGFWFHWLFPTWAHTW